LPEILERLRQRGEEATARVTTALTASAIDVQTDARKNVGVASGRLRNSIAYTVGVKPLRARVGTNLKHAEAVERGVRPEKLKHYKTGKVGYFAPIGTTDTGRRWLMSHGFVEGVGKTITGRAWTLYGKRTSLRALKMYGRRSSLTTRRESSPLIPTGIIVSGAPRPFLLPAFEANKARIISRMEEALKTLGGTI